MQQNTNLVPSRVVHAWRRVSGWFRDDLFRRLFLNAGKLLSANIIAAILGLVATILVARALGPESYGVLALLLVYVQTIGTLISFNVWQAFIKYGSEALQANDRVGLCQLIKFGFLLDIGSAIVGTVVAIVLSQFVIAMLGWDSAVQPFLVLYSLLLLFALNGTPTGVLRLFDRFDLLSYTAVLTMSARLTGVVWCLLTRQNLYGFVLCYLIANIFGQLYQICAALLVLRKHNVGRIVFRSLKCFRQRFPGIWDYVWTTNINSTIRMLSRLTDEFVVAALTSPAALGLYKIAKQFSLILSMLVDSCYQSIYPELSRLWAAGNARSFISLVKRTSLLIGGIVLCGWLGFIIFGQWLIVLTVGPAFQEAYSVIVVYMFALVIAACTFSFTPSMLAIGLPKNALKALIASTGVYIVMLPLFVNALGIMGASVSYVGFYFVWSGIMLRYLHPYFSSA